jgi:phage I-like protein
MQNNMPQAQIAVAACLVDLNGAAPGTIKLAPAGLFSAKDGRPHGLPGWTLNAAAAQKVIDRTAAMTDKILIDYEHQALYSRENGKPAPAAGWYKTLEWRDGDGLYATDVEWTAAARTAIENREYRYISPVLTYHPKTGEVTGILMAALVNYPAIDGLNDLAAAHFDLTRNEETPVNKALLALLGLETEPTDEQILAKVAELKARLEKIDALTAEIADKTEQIAVLKAAAEPDASQFVPVAVMEALKQQVATLAAQVETKEKEELIQAALADGRLLPGQKQWYETVDLAALKTYLAHAQPIAALAGMQTEGQAPSGESTTADATKLAALAAKYQAEQAALGINVDDITAIEHVSKQG